MENRQGLIKGCLKGHVKSQERLYEQYAPKMMSVCARYAPNDAEAADILQEGFVKVFNNLQKLRNPQQLESWITGIMINTALDMLRKRRTHQGFEVPLQEQHDQTRDEEITSQLSTDELLSLIQTLPDGYRLVFNLYAIEGYTHPEIAEKLNITAGASKSQYARAKKLLQEKVEALNPDLIKNST